MSRGVLDQEAYDAAVKATAYAKAHGLKIVGGGIYHRPDGTRLFTWQYEPDDKPKRERKSRSEPAGEPISRDVNDSRAPPPSMTHDPDAFEEDIRQRVGRGGVPKPRPVQEELNL